MPGLNITNNNQMSVAATQQNNSNLNHRIYTARNNLVKVYKKQGFDVSPFEGTDISEVNQMQQNRSLDMELIHTESDRKTYIHFYLASQLTKDKIQPTIDFYFEGGILKPTDELLIIITKDPNETMKEYLKLVWERDGYYINIKNLARCQFVAQDNVRVPKAYIESSDERITTFFKMFNILKSAKYEQMPLVSRFDPVSIELGCRPGQIYVSLRPSKTGIFSPYWRLCVNEINVPEK